MSYKTEELLGRDPFNYLDADKRPGGEFIECLREELIFHFENNVKYRRFCDAKHFNPHNWSGKCEEIPPVQVSVFKTMGKELSSVPKDEIRLTLQSSATSGVPSSIPVDKITSKRQAKAMVKVIGDAIGNSRKPFLVMDVDPAEGFKEILGARYAAVTGYLNFASTTNYFLKVNENKQYYFDMEGIEKCISELKSDEPVVVFGFTYILYSEVVKPLSNDEIELGLPKGSKVIHIGGWKKLESEKVDKEEFNNKVAALFGIEPCDVIDIYGFTEQMGINYPECKCGYKHAPLYSEVIVRDIFTKKPLEPHKQGLLEFVSPIPHSYPGNAVLTDDLGIWTDEPCPYGRAGLRFKMVGRLKKAEVRGCGDILSSKLKFAGDITANNLNGDDKYSIVYYPDKQLFDVVNPRESLRQLEKSLRNQLGWIRNQPIDSLIGLIAKCAAKWNADDMSSEKLAELKMNGVGFLAKWCTPEHLIRIMDEGLNGNRKHIDSFVPVSDDGIQLRKATSRGLVCHYLAGNVQVLGMFALIESILCKNVNLLKLSSRDDGIFAELLKVFEGESYTTKGGHTIYGDDLLKTIALVYYDHNSHELGKEMSSMADVRIAWGGRDAVLTVSRYPSSYDCQDIIMGPKISFAVVDKESLQDEHSARKVARKIAVDASVFDQTGCASAHNVFVEKEGAVSPEEFAKLLAEGMKKTAAQIPKGYMSSEQISQIHSIRGIYDFKGIVIGDDDNIWTILYSDDLELCDPVYSRVLFVHPVDHINDAIVFVNEDIQTIGLAATGEKAIDFAIEASEKGAVRFPLCGKMLNFDSPWDGLYITDKMVKWITLGGPVV